MHHLACRSLVLRLQCAVLCIAPDRQFNPLLCCLTTPARQVFDSGCIGEGVLHILAAAQAKLLAPGAAMVPAAARVFCQPIQLRTSQVLGWDCSQANRWRWRPDYEGLELGKCRCVRRGPGMWGWGETRSAWLPVSAGACTWDVFAYSCRRAARVCTNCGGQSWAAGRPGPRCRAEPGSREPCCAPPSPPPYLLLWPRRDRWVALAPPQEVFSFDFRDVFQHMAPAEAALDLCFEAGGVFNAVAMWFKLQLDEEASLRWGSPGRQCGEANVQLCRAEVG